MEYPRAILHVDGDAFFASCEVARNPALKGKPVVTGQERGIACAFTYEAKALGVVRGMSVREIRKRYPSVTVLPSDYATYSLYSKRMYNIVRRYSPCVDEYSIDECFADLTGQDEVLKLPLEEIVRRIKYDLDTELGITFSVGLAPTKVLAKIGSKWRKPSGLTCIPMSLTESFLKDLPIGKVWGIGWKTTTFLQRMRIVTALDFVKKDVEWVQKYLSKPYFETWCELRGKVMFELHQETKTSQHSIAKTLTFVPCTDKAYIYSQLSNNIEGACAKARSYGLGTQKISIFLKTQDFKYHHADIKLPSLTSTPEDILRSIEPHFHSLFASNTVYRTTGISLLDLRKPSTQQTLFETIETDSRMTDLYRHIDRLSHKFGKHSIFLGSSLNAIAKQGKKSVIWKKIFDIPSLGEVS